MRTTTSLKEPDADELIKRGLRSAIYKISETARSKNYYRAYSFCDKVCSYWYLFEDADWKFIIPGLMHQLTEKIDYGTPQCTEKVIKTLELIGPHLSESPRYLLIKALCEPYTGETIYGKLRSHDLKKFSIHELETMLIHLKAIAALANSTTETSKTQIATIIAEIFNLTRGVSLNVDNRDRIKCYLALQRQIIKAKAQFSKIIPAAMLDNYLNQYKSFKHASFPNRFKMFSKPSAPTEVKSLAEPVATKSTEIFNTLHTLVGTPPRDANHRISAYKLMAELIYIIPADEVENYEKFILIASIRCEKGDEIEAFYKNLAKHASLLSNGTLNKLVAQYFKIEFFNINTIAALAKHLLPDQSQKLGLELFTHIKKNLELFNYDWDENVLLLLQSIPKKSIFALVLDNIEAIQSDEVTSSTWFRCQRIINLQHLIDQEQRVQLLTKLSQHCNYFASAAFIHTYDNYYRKHDHHNVSHCRK